MTEDLSMYHAPVTRLFRAPATSAEWEQCRLTDEQVAFCAFGRDLTLGARAGMPALPACRLVVPAEVASSSTPL